MMLQPLELYSFLAINKSSLLRVGVFTEFPFSCGCCVFLSLSNITGINYCFGLFVSFVPASFLFSPHVS